MQRFTLIIVVFLVSAFAGSCIPSTETNKASNSTVDVRQSLASPRAEVVESAAASKANSNTAAPVTAASKQECYDVETGDDVVMKPQTFPIDFAPFAGGCFVTTYNPEYDDPPMESQYAIYTNGKVALDLPEQFNGATFGCWVDGVAFQDVNKDDLKDIIVVGKCSAKSKPYNENMVYINTGKTFVTRPDGNSQLSNFTKVKEIADFAEDNQQIFYK